MVSAKLPVSAEATLGRRTLLGAAIGTSALAGLTACAPEASPQTPPTTGSSGEDGAAQPPTYTPFEGVTPDLAPTAEGVPPGFYDYPNPPLPLDGYPRTGIAPFTTLLQGSPPNVAPDKNKNFALMAEQLGTTFDTTFGSYTEYLTKFQTTIAGGDLPDIVQVVAVPQLPTLLEKNFTDLTDVLAGDKVTQYPGLANIPGSTWTVATINGRIWGVSRPQPPAGQVINYREDIMAERGVSADELNPTDGDEFLALMEKLTDAGAGEFAMGADPTVWLLAIAKQMAGTPNGWANDGGNFVSDIASEQMKDALDYCRRVWEAGVLHPNSFSEPAQNGTWYAAGVTALFIRGFGGWDFNIRANPDTTIQALVPPKLTGGGPAPVHKTPAGYSAFMAIRKTDDADRVDQLLQVFDFCAAPFGTEQYLALNYGVEGYSYELDDAGNPNPIADAPQTPDSYTYAGGARTTTVYSQGDKESVDLRHEYMMTVVPTAVDDASTGLFSETATGKAATTAAERADVIRRIMQGDQPVSSWDDYVTKWKGQVGDAMAEEYGTAAAN